MTKQTPKNNEHEIRKIMDTNKKIGLEDNELFDMMNKSFNKGRQSRKEDTDKIIDEVYKTKEGIMTNGKRIIFWDSDVDDYIKELKRRLNDKTRNIG